MLVWHFELEGLQARSGGMGVQMGDLAPTGAQNPFFYSIRGEQADAGFNPSLQGSSTACWKGCWAPKLPPTDVARG